MTCVEGKIEHLSDGTSLKCLDGQWVILPAPPDDPNPAPVSWQFREIERLEDFKDPAVMEAVEDSKRTVVLYILDH